jgi:D-alanyl-D-alanine carboxypeptidase
MKNTSFVDPTGLSNANKATARDVALLVTAAARSPLIAEYSTTPHHVASLGKRSLQYINSNRLVRRSSWDIDLQKTGYIVEAGRCLTMATEVAGRNLVMVLLDAESNGQRLADAERLRRWAVAEWGGPAAVAALKAETAPRKAASAKKKARAGTRKVVTAKKKDTPGKKATASKGTAKKTAVASKKDSTREPVARKKEGRVKQTFASGKDREKS